MKEQPILEYIHAHGGAMNAFQTFVEEHHLTHPASHVAHEIETLTQKLAHAQPLERLHRVVDYICAEMPRIYGYYPEHPSSL